MQRLRDLFLALPWYFRNIFFLSAVFFIVWMLFFDENNWILQYQRHNELKKLKEKEKYYIEEIIKTDDQYRSLTTDKASQEKFARENYWMKKDNEDVFVIKEK